jgi:replicative DNA helicase
MDRESLSLRIAASEAPVDHRSLRTGRVADTDWPRLHNTGAALSKMALDIDDRSALSIAQIQAAARRAHALGRCGMLVVDYLQLARDEGRRGGNREQEISEISRGLKAVAKDLRIPVLALSQLNRGLESRDNKRPLLSDLRESGSVEQDADVVVMVYRDAVYSGNAEDDSAELIVRKQRNGELGTATVRFDGARVRFLDKAPDYREDDGRFGR